MKKTVFFFVLILSIAGQVSATHIVGGEFEITYISGDNYRFSLIQYFDVVNGNPDAEDYSILATIFRKRDNTFVRSVTLNKMERSILNYTNPDCTNDKLVTRKIVYSATVTLDTYAFSDPEGYYMVWERCCRNGIITNITSPDKTGQTFYIEFPPVRKDNVEFRNSSPQLFPPLSDYACVGRMYFVDFRGYDPDGDVLKYKLITPLNSSVYDPLPTPSPSPHPEVNWIPGVSTDNQIPGTPTLQISSNGFLTVNPSEEGLFVFSVLCEEFRDGIKIGEVRRDFQLLVLDCQSGGQKPEIAVKIPGTDIYESDPGIIEIGYGDDHCLDLVVKDMDGNENISLQALPVNFDGDLQDIIDVTNGVLISPDDSLITQICLPECPFSETQPQIINVLARDNTCPQGLFDTLTLSLMVEPPPNNAPVVTVNGQEGDQEIQIRIEEGINLLVEATDQDADEELSLTIHGEDFHPENYGMLFENITGKNNISGDFSWDVNCNAVDLAVKDSFNVFFVADDKDKCDSDNQDTVQVKIKVLPPLNENPELQVNDGIAQDTIFIFAGEEVNLNFTGSDPDNDNITLEMLEEKLNSDTTGLIQFEPVSGQGAITASLNWQTDCSFLGDQFRPVHYSTLFVLKDDQCAVQGMDSVEIHFVIREREVDYDILPPNVFTPNGDDYNAYFYVPEIPEDNCHRQFRKVQIFNRWGKLVFSSESRDFKWDGRGSSNGVYFYFLDFGEVTYKGTLTLLR